MAQNPPIIPYLSTFLSFSHLLLSAPHFPDSGGEGSAATEDEAGKVPSSVPSQTRSRSSCWKSTQSMLRPHTSHDRRCGSYAPPSKGAAHRAAPVLPLATHELPPPLPPGFAGPRSLPELRAKVLTLMDVASPSSGGGNWQLLTTTTTKLSGRHRRQEFCWCSSTKRTGRRTEERTGRRGEDERKRGRWKDRG